MLTCPLIWGVPVRLWEVSVANRQSLIDPVVWLMSKITQPQGMMSYFITPHLAPCITQLNCSSEMNTKQ